jgi:hypothetical protein
LSYAFLAHAVRFFNTPSNSGRHPGRTAYLLGATAKRWDTRVDVKIGFLKIATAFCGVRPLTCHMFIWDAGLSVII